MTASPGLLEALRRVAATALAMGHSRLELASIEAVEAGERLINALMIGVLGMLMLFAALVSLSVWAVWLLWASLGPAALLLLALLYLACGAALLTWMRGRLRAQPPALAATLAELRRDVVMLRGEADRSGSDAERP
jgi:uncharacterized membrane protein YqjE